MVAPFLQPLLQPGEVVAVLQTPLLGHPHRPCPAVLLISFAVQLYQCSCFALFVLYLILLQVSWGMQLLQEPVPSPEGPAAKAAVGDLINAAAAAAGATAIIAASASPGGLAEWLRGSVTHHLANTAQVPVVVLHRPKQPDRSRSGSPWWLAATMDSHLTREPPQQQVGRHASSSPARRAPFRCLHHTMSNGLLYALLPVQADNILCCLSKAGLPTQGPRVNVVAAP